MEDIGAIGKGKQSLQGFMYRGVDDVINALNPAFIKHRLFMVPEVLEQRREERQTAKGGLLVYSICRMKYTFYAADGSSVSAVVAGEGMDSGDKSTNKAMSAAFKYACCQVFCISTEEMAGPDGESHEIRPTGGTRSQRARSNGQVQQQSKPPRRIHERQSNDLMNECDRTGKNWRDICALYQVEQFSDMTEEQYIDCMKRFKSTPDKQAAGENGGLPWDNLG